MRFLDIDLDAFLSSVAFYRNGGERLDPEAYQPWTEARLRDFLERQCGLSRDHPIPGWFVEDHDGAFDVMRALVGDACRPLEVIHVDAHADLGMGDASWVDLIEHVGLPLAERREPKRGDHLLSLGSWLAYALAADFISALTYVHPARRGKDLTAIHFRNGDVESGSIEMKAYTRPDLPADGASPDYWRLVKLAPDLALAPVPFATATLDDFAATAPFDVGLLCHSPSYTPATADALIPIVGEYIDFQGGPFRSGQ